MRRAEMDIPASPLKVILANEPRAYREVISAVLKELRPDMEVFTIEPKDLDREFVRLVPHLVVCNRLTGLVGRGAPGWIELYPDGASHAVVSLAGDRTTYTYMDLETLISILDGIAAELYQKASLQN